MIPGLRLSGRHHVPSKLTQSDGASLPVCNRMPIGDLYDRKIVRIDEAASLPRVGKHSLQIIQVASKLSIEKDSLKFML